MNNKKSTISFGHLLKSFGFWGSVVTLIVFFGINKPLGIVLAVVVLIIWAVKRRKRNKKERIITEANSFISKIKTDGKLSPVQTSAMLGSDEQAFLVENSQLQETRSVRKTSGGFGGIRIAKGVFVGRSSSRSESHQEWRTLDNGQLILTNKRVMYLGNKENRNILLDKIMSVETWARILRIRSRHRQLI